MLSSIDATGIILCDRYAYPPNSLLLCGPDKQVDLAWYSSSGKIDRGNIDILTQFSTLYPYLTLIARENNLKNPFDKRVVEAYWLGNSLLKNIKIKSLSNHLIDSLSLKKKLIKKDLIKLLNKLPYGLMPHHAFHVLNIYKRTGNISDAYTLQTMDACIINYGQVEKILPNSMIIKTKPLTYLKEKIVFGSIKQREVFFQDEKDWLSKKVHIGDYISYHWGYFCDKLTPGQLRNLIYYTNLSLSLANNNDTLRYSKIK